MLLTPGLKEKAEAISKEIRESYGDRGTCILGYEMFLDGVKVVSQPAQGCLTCGRVYGAIEEMLLENGIDESDIKINYGVID